MKYPNEYFLGENFDFSKFNKGEDTPNWKRFAHILAKMLEDKYGQGNVILEHKCGKMRCGMGNKIVDIYIKSTNTLVECKYQEVQGTAMNKISYEVDTLQDMIEDYGFSQAYIVLGGSFPSWEKKKDYYTSETMVQRRKQYAPNVHIKKHTDFIKELQLNEKTFSKVDWK